MYLPSHSIQQQIVPNSVKLLPKSATDNLNSEDISGDFLTVIGNMHDYLVGGTDEEFSSQDQVRSWFTYVVYSGILKLGLPTSNYHLNIGVDLKTFYQDSLMPTIRPQKKIKLKEKGQVTLMSLDLSEVHYYPNIYAAAIFLANKYLDKKHIVIHLRKNTFEGICYTPGQPYSKQDYVIGNRFDQSDYEKDVKPDHLNKVKYLQQLVKKATKLFSHAETAPVYILKDAEIEQVIVADLQAKFTGKNLIYLDNHPFQLISEGLFLIGKAETMPEQFPTVGISSSKDQSYFTAPKYLQLLAS